ncbi:MAG TPA: response regulator transcription factor [Prolixibacteraceae bacterium]|nr:response regulator transcription factor [Prolixibacteraceae bacterium]
MTKKLFFVEDDLSFGSVMKSYLELNDYQVTWIDDGKYAVERFKNGTFDLAILDVMLPNVDGFTIGKEIKAIAPALPMIYLTAKTLKEDILKGYGIGADDYVTKPFDSEVLLCKLKAIMSRNQPEETKTHREIYQLGEFKFNYRFRTIERNEVKVTLSPKEAGLLRLLCLRKNELLPREEALQKLWGDDDYFTARSMDVYVTKLRKFLKDDPSIEIRNIHGSGFMLEIAD